MNNVVIIASLTDRQWLDLGISLLAIVLIFYLVKDGIARSVFLLFVALFVVRIFVLHKGLFVFADLLAGITLVGLLGTTLVFSKEIRGFFYKLAARTSKITSGSVNTFTPFSDIDPEVQKTIETTLQKLKSTGDGALIVVRRQDDPLNYGSGGVAVDGQLSSELLVALFQKTSPLHDGAVIVEGDQITRAAVVLPLSNSSELGDMGTRHRAAIGMSEVCDAYMYVLSEESGEVSCFHRGAKIPI